MTKRRRKNKGPEGSVLPLLTLGMFVYGAGKGLLAGGGGDGCPLCEMERLGSAAHALSTVVIGPAMEELQFRQALPKVLGAAPSAAIFGALHASPWLGAGNVLRVLEAGLAGGLLYAKAYELGGVRAATLVHGAHNLGVNVGSFFVARNKVRKGAWHRAPVQVAPGVTALLCRRGRRGQVARVQ